MMIRDKTAIEKSESPQQQAERLRYALFVIADLHDLTEVHRVARAAMAGQLHGHEQQDDKPPPHRQFQFPPRYSSINDPWPPPGEQGPQADADAQASGYRRREKEPGDTA
jgi:hypothetical protein